MCQMNLSIFIKETDANAVGLGFYYQYEATLNSWLKNYVSNSPTQIFCETEDDIKEINVESDLFKFSQVKCYSSGFSLNSIEIKKTICNFYMLYRKYQSHTVMFEFITNTNIIPSEKVLSKWVMNQGNIGNENENHVLLEVNKILEEYFIINVEKKEKVFDKKIFNLQKKITGKNDKKFLDEIRLIQKEKDDLKILLKELLQDISNNDKLIQFINRIKWTFNSINPEFQLIKLKEENKRLIENIENSTDALDLIHGRLFSEVHLKSSNKNINDRMLDNNLLKQILDESKIEMERKVDKSIIEKINELNKKYFEIENEIKNIKEVQEVITDENYTHIKKEFQLYGEKKILEFDEKMNEENFSIYDIYVEPEFYSFPYRGDLLINEEFKIDEEDEEEMDNILFYLDERLKGKDNLLLIHGDPGIGKSSLSKVIYKTYFEEENHLLPFHVELKTVNYSQNFRNTIFNEISENIKGFDNIHLKNLNILLILDGFDELHLLSEGSLRNFFDSLIYFVEKYSNIKVILTGRTTAFAEMSDLIPTRTEILILKKFEDYQVRLWLNNWMKYKKISKNYINELNTFDNYQETILGFPLILYLFCKMLEENNSLSPNEMFNLERWEFYERVIDWTCATSKFIEESDFNPLRKEFNIQELSIIKRELNQNIALSMYHKNKFSITQKEILSKKLIPMDYLTNKQKENIDDTDFKIINTFIVLNYMRPTEKKHESDIAFEFVHKSFYEFLASESLIKNLLKLRNTNLDVEEIARLIYENFGGFKINHEMKAFFKPLLMNKSSTDVREIYINLKRLYSDFILQHSFINNNTKILDTYFVKYPENSFKKINIETNIIHNIFFLLSFISEMLNELFEIGNNEDRRIKSLLFNDLQLSTLSLNNFLIKDTKFIGENFENIDFSDSMLQKITFKALDINYSSFQFCQLINITLEGCHGYSSLFEKADIQLSYFNNSTLKSANFSSGKLQSVNFNNTILEDSLYEESKLSNCIFENVSLENVYFYKTIITDTSFNNCDLQNSDFRYAVVKNSIFINADISNSNLKEANFSNTDLTGVNFMYTNLEGVNFTNANLSNALLKGANIKGVNFTNANLSGVDFSEILLHNDKIPCCDFTGANLTNSNFATLNLTNLRLVNINLTGANLAYTNLEKCDLSYSSLLNTILSSSILINANLSNTNIKLSNFENSNLSFCNLNMSQISYSSFIETDLFHSTFERACIDNSDFESSEMFIVNIEKADIRDCNFNNASIDEVIGKNIATLVNNISFSN